MRRFIPFWLLLSLILCVVPVLPGCTGDISTAPAASKPADALVKETQAATATIKLPEPKLTGEMSLEEAIAGRRSVRSFTDSPITLQDLSQILWSGQGITDSTGKRAAPSAMRSYPLTIYIIAINVTGLGNGVYKYVPDGHQLAIVNEGEIKENVMPNKAPVYLAITADSTEIVKKVGDIGKRFAYLEAGHAAQNICLQATTLGLATVTAAGFQEATLRAILALPDGPELLYIMPVGKKAS
jgi:SagB-type dehydrogenase family enzyme